MTITLDAAEVARAVEKYVRGKNTSDSPHHDYAVRMVWRGEHAVVTITRKEDVPTLTDKVRDAKSWGY